MAEETGAFLVRGRAAEVIEVIEPAITDRSVPGVAPDPDATAQIAAEGEAFVPPRRLPTQIPRRGKEQT